MKCFLYSESFNFNLLVLAITDTNFNIQTKFVYEIHGVMFDLPLVTAIAVAI